VVSLFFAFSAVIVPMLPATVAFSTPSMVAVLYGYKNRKTSTAYDQQERNNN
jgi:hypothetical protein